MKKLLNVLFLLFFLSTQLQAANCFGGRYIDSVFQKADVTRGITYARKQQSDGFYIDLKYDVYEPQGDTLAQRPVMFLIHGGAYLKLLDQSSPDIVLLCNYFVKRGYVAVSIDYRQEPNPLSLLSEEQMVKAVSRALLDTKEAVDHLVRTYQNGNPYRIDTSRAFLGGVSAGAVSSMFIGFLDSLTQLSPQYQNWIIQANGPESDSILRHRFDLVKPKAIISISGALLDTSWINTRNIDILLVHGSQDEIVPYNFGHPLNIQALPMLYGGKAMYPRLISQDIRTEFDDWIGRGHVPFLNLDQGLNLINYPILDSTERHIARFCYPLLGCDNLSAIVEQAAVASLTIFPNPSNGHLKLLLPKYNSKNKWSLIVYDINGKEQYKNEIPGGGLEFFIPQKLSQGTYYFILQEMEETTNIKYIGTAVIM